MVAVTNFPSTRKLPVGLEAVHSPALLRLLERAVVALPVLGALLLAEERDRELHLGPELDALERRSRVRPDPILRDDRLVVGEDEGAPAVVEAARVRDGR